MVAQNISDLFTFDTYFFIDLKFDKVSYTYLIYETIVYNTFSAFKYELSPSILIPLNTEKPHAQTQSV